MTKGRPKGAKVWTDEKLKRVKEFIKSLLKDIRDDLNVHIKRSEYLEGLLDIAVERIEKLEEPQKFLKHVRTVALWVISVSACVKLIIELI